MRFDPEIRQEKYGILREQVLSRGLRTEILLGEGESDAMVIWNGELLRDPREGPERVVVSGRRRGWFVRLADLATYRVPSRDVIPDIVLGVMAPTMHGDEQEAIAEIVREFMLTPVEQSAWHKDESEEQRLEWEKAGWFVLEQNEETQLWAQFSKTFLRPDGTLQIPVPAMTWPVPDLSHDNLDGSCKAEALLSLAVFDALRQCIIEGQFVIALDWDHPCYRFFPYAGIRKPYRDYWPVPVWPRGGSYYFVASDFRYGILASQAGKLHVFGQDLIEASNAGVSKVLGPPRL